MVLYVHKGRTSDLSEVDICDDFVADSETRLRILAKFCKNLNNKIQFCFTNKTHITTEERMMY